MNEMEMGVEELGFHQGLFRKFRQIKEAISKGGARLEINQGVFMQFNDSVKFEKYFSDTYGPAVLEKCQNYEQQEMTSMNQEKMNRGRSKNRNMIKKYAYEIYNNF